MQRYHESDIKMRLIQRANMISGQIIPSGVVHDTALRAMLDVPRHLFVPHELMNVSYSDAEMPISHLLPSRKMLKPEVIARAIEVLVNKVLEIQSFDNKAKNIDNDNDNDNDNEDINSLDITKVQKYTTNKKKELAAQKNKNKKLRSVINDMHTIKDDIDIMNSDIISLIEYYVRKNLHHEYSSIKHNIANNTYDVENTDNNVITNNEYINTNTSEKLSDSNDNAYFFKKIDETLLISYYKNYSSNNNHDDSKNRHHNKATYIDNAYNNAYNNHKRLNVLDIGSGLGYSTILLSRFCDFVTGVECNNEIVKQSELLASKIGATNVRFLYQPNLLDGDPGSHVELKEKYDIIFLGYAVAENSLLSNHALLNQLKPHGVVLVFEKTINTNIIHLVIYENVNMTINACNVVTQRNATVVSNDVNDATFFNTNDNTLNTNLKLHLQRRKLTYCYAPSLTL